MKTKYLIRNTVLQVLILNILFVCVSNGQVKYEDYFTSKSLRIDFHLAGNSNSTEVTIEQLKREPFWSGPVNNLIDPFNYGSYRVEVIDSASGNMIYSKGFSTLYQEWQTTAEAKVNTRSFFQVIRIPFPRSTVEFRLFARNKDQLFDQVFEKYINPNDYFITKEDPDIYSLNRIMYAGDPASHVDLVFLPEGYSAGEMEKFMKNTGENLIFGQWKPLLRTPEQIFRERVFIRIQYLIFHSIHLIFRDILPVMILNQLGMLQPMLLTII